MNGASPAKPDRIAPYKIGTNCRAGMSGSRQTARRIFKNHFAESYLLPKHAVYTTLVPTGIIYLPQKCARKHKKETATMLCACLCNNPLQTKIL